jgi:serine/threonine protein kinase
MAVQTEIIVVREGAEILRRSMPPGEYVVGRSRDCDLIVTGDLISRHHARLVIAMGSLVIEDLASSNGTLVDGQVVTEPKRFFPGQKVQVGTVTLDFRQFPAPASGISDAPVEKSTELPPVPTPLPTPLPAHAITPPNPTPIRPIEPFAPGVDEAEFIRRNLPLEDRKAQHLETQREIARGGMGVIFATKESATRRTVAMKVMYEERDTETAARFIEEAQVTAQLEHPNIVPIYDLGVGEDGQPFYTMKLVVGITLYKVLELIRKRVPETVEKYPLGTLLTIFQKICDALAFAHSKGVIHRDLKPANVMLGKYGEVMVMDWGLAKIIGKKKAASAAGPKAANIENTVLGLRGNNVDGFATMAGSIMGTPQYMSPEQASGEIDNLDGRSDIYTLGIILYELLTLEIPFNGRNPAEILANIEAGEYTPPATRIAKTPAKERPLHLPDGKVPESLGAIVRKAMAREPSKRYRTVQELQDDVIAYQSGFATSAEKAGLAKQVVLLIKRHRGIVATAATAWLIVTALIGWFVVKVTNERNRAESALASLRQASPTLIADAQMLVRDQKFDEAISKVDLALRSEPGNAEYHLLRAQLLEANFQMRDAVKEFQRVLNIGPNESASRNLDLCQRILDATPPGQEPSTAALYMLLDLLNSEGRGYQAAPLAARLGPNQKTLSALGKARVESWRKLPNFDKVRAEDRINNGDKNVNASWLPIKELDWLHSLPVETLNLDHTQVSDLSALVGLHLKEFHAANTDVADLKPLHSLQVHLVSLNDCKWVADFSPLVGLPLDYFEANNTNLHDLGFLQNDPIRSVSVSGTDIKSLAPLNGKSCWRIVVANCRDLVDVAALQGMPLRELNLENCVGITDVGFLTSCPELEKVTVPRGAKNIDALVSLKKLRSIGFNSSEQWSPEEFWAQRFPNDEQWKPKIAEVQRGRAALAACGLSKPEIWRVKLLDDGTFDIVASTTLKTIEPLCLLPVSVLDIKSSGISDLTPVGRLTMLRRLRIESTPVKNLAPLAACRQLEVLYAASTPVGDLTPLRGLPLIALDVSGIHSVNLSPLEGMPLRVLHLERTTIADAHSLLSCSALEWLGINRDAKHLEELRRLPKLTRISYEWSLLDKPDLDPFRARPLKTASEYWAEVDSSKVHKDNP